MISRRMAMRIGMPLVSAGLILGTPAISQVQQTLSVGAGKAAIEIPAGLLPFQGFGVEHDKLMARVLVLDNGSGRLAVAVIDLTSISDDTVTRMKQTINRVAGVDPANILICAGHSFSAPHILPPGRGAADEAQKDAQYKDTVDRAVLQAATAAARGMRPASMGFGVGSANVNVNRNMPTVEGWWLGADDHGSSDKSVAVVRFDDAEHHPLAVLMNYAVQPSIMDQSIVKDGTKAISADLAGAAVRRVEEQYGEPTVSLFLDGAAGDQAPSFKADQYVLDKDGKAKLVDIGEQGYPLIDLLGERLGVETVRVSDGIKTDSRPTKLRVVSGTVQLDAQVRPRELQSLHPSKTYDYKATGKVGAPYSVMQIGDVAIVGVQVELSSVTGTYIKQHSPFKKTIVVTMVNGSAKYLPEAESYRKITYESMNSSYGPGSAEILSKKILQTLASLSGNSAK